MRRARLRLFRGRNRNPTLDGIGGALEEAFDFLAADEQMEADMKRLIAELKEIEGRPAPPHAAD